MVEQTLLRHGLLSEAGRSVPPPESIDLERLVPPSPRGVVIGGRLLRVDDGTTSPLRRSRRAVEKQLALGFSFKAKAQSFMDLGGES